MATPEIKRAFRGVDAVEVDNYLGSLQARLADLNIAISDRNRVIQRLNREIADPNIAAPSFAELGSTFQETLRLAEEKAFKIREDAAVELTSIANAVNIEVENLQNKTQREAKAIIEIAQAEANEIRLGIEAETAAERQRIADERAQSDALQVRADRNASNLISQTEINVGEKRTAAHQQVVEIRNEANEIIKAASDRRVEAENRVTSEIEDAQATAAAIHAEADTYATSAYAQADAHVQDAIERSTELKEQADQHLAAANIRATEILQDSREIVQKSVSEAMEISNEIQQRTEEFFQDFTFDAENSIAEVRKNRLGLLDYSTHIRGVSNTINLEAIEEADRERLEIQAKVIEDGGK